MITIYETERSIYEVDLENWRYRRGPNADTAYQAPEIRNPGRSHRLVDGIWVGLKKGHPNPVQIVQNDWGDDVLHIMAFDATDGIYTSPIVAIHEVESSGP